MKQNSCVFILEMNKKKILFSNASTNFHSKMFKLSHKSLYDVAKIIT